MSFHFDMVKMISYSLSLVCSVSSVMVLFHCADYKKWVHTKYFMVCRVFFGKDYSFCGADDILFTLELLLPHFWGQVTTHNAVPKMSSRSKKSRKSTQPTLQQELDTFNVQDIKDNLPRQNKLFKYCNTCVWSTKPVPMLLKLSTENCVMMTHIALVYVLQISSKCQVNMWNNL